jgi:hypothetical protein
VTTQTVGLGSDYQSYDPVYEWWIRFAPRYTAYSDDKQDISLNLWMNFYKELTNSDETTQYRENVLGATTLWAAYSRKVLVEKEWVTTVNVSPVRLGLPTDKAQQNAGVYFNLGASAGVSQAIPIEGKSSKWFPNSRFGLTAAYNHPFVRATNPTNESLDRIRGMTEFGIRILIDSHPQMSSPTPTSTPAPASSGAMYLRARAEQQAAAEGLTLRGYSITRPVT